MKKKKKKRWEISIVNRFARIATGRYRVELTLARSVRGPRSQQDKKSRAKNGHKERKKRKKISFFPKKKLINKAPRRRENHLAFLFGLVENIKCSTTSTARGRIPNHSIVNASDYVFIALVSFPPGCLIDCNMHGRIKRTSKTQ